MADNKKSIHNMSDLELFQHVRAIARNDANICLSDHAKYERMKGRKVTWAEVVRCLQLGRMNRAPEPGKYDDELKCRFDHHDFERKQIGVEVVVSNSASNLLVVTVIRYA